MIISSTPLRMSFVGGGSDLPVFYRRYGGAVVSTTIDKYLYITVNKKFDQKIRLSYSITEEVESPEVLKHELVKAALKLLDIDGGVEITSISDIPATGSGLGSSSAFTAGLLLSLKAYQSKYIDKKDLAKLTCHVELDVCGEPIGKQDQYASVYGGLNFIRFNPDDSVEVKPIICQAKTQKELEHSLIMFHTGISRPASEALTQQCNVLLNDEKKQQVLYKMAGLAEVLYKELCNNNIGVFGEILHENWLLKKSITDRISTDQIDTWYNKALKAGAVGGKLLGAGGGGFLVFFAPPECHESVKLALKDLRPVNFAFEREGSRIIFYDGVRS